MESTTVKKFCPPDLGGKFHGGRGPGTSFAPQTLPARNRRSSIFFGDRGWEISVVHRWVRLGGAFQISPISRTEPNQAPRRRRYSRVRVRAPRQGQDARQSRSRRLLFTRVVLTRRGETLKCSAAFSIAVSLGASSPKYSIKSLKGQRNSWAKAR